MQKIYMKVLEQKQILGAEMRHFDSRIMQVNLPKLKFPSKASKDPTFFRIRQKITPRAVSTVQSGQGQRVTF
jgi:hypothetical protein